MPTAMEYAINTIVGLCQENTKLRMKVVGEALPQSEEDTASIITTADWEKLKASADLIAEAKEKQIKRMAEEMTEKDKRIAELEKQLAEEKELCLITKNNLVKVSEIVFQKSKGTFGSPFMEYPTPINGVLRQ